MTSGTVKWFNGASGYGYIVPDGGGSDLFVHRASIGGDFGAPVTESEGRVRDVGGRNGPGSDQRRCVHAARGSLMTAHSPLQSAQVAAPPAATDQPGRTAGPSDLTDTRVGPEWTAESQPLASSLTSTFSDQMAEGATALGIWEGEGGPSVAEPPELSDQGTRRGGLPVGLDWSAFSARLFPGRRRHDLEALKAYEAYRNLSESETNYCLTDARATGHAELERPESTEIVTKTANVKLPSQPYVKTSTRRRFYGSPAAG